MAARGARAARAHAPPSEQAPAQVPRRRRGRGAVPDARRPGEASLGHELPARGRAPGVGRRRQRGPREPAPTAPRERPRWPFPVSRPGPTACSTRPPTTSARLCKTQKEFIVAAPKMPLALPAVLLAEKTSVKVGGTARFLVHSGLPDQPLFLDIYRGGVRTERRRIVAGKGDSVVEIPVTEKERGGFGVALVVLDGYQIMQFTQAVFVPWDDKELKVEFATFRDKVRPGAKETWRVTVKSPGGGPVEAGAAELLAYMYDRSLDLFAPHNPPAIPALYPSRAGASTSRANLGRPTPATARTTTSCPCRATRASRGTSSSSTAATASVGPGRGYKGGVEGGIVAEMAAMPMAAPPPAPAMKSMAANAPSDQASRDEKKDKEEANAVTAPAEAPATEITLQLRRDGLLAAAAPHGSRRLGVHRVHRARFGDLVERLGARGHQGPEGRLPPQGDEERQGPHGPPLPAPLPARGRPRRHQGRGEQRLGPRLQRRSDLRDPRPRDQREPPEQVRPRRRHRRRSPSR